MTYDPIVQAGADAIRRHIVTTAERLDESWSWASTPDPEQVPFPPDSPERVEDEQADE